MARYKPQDRTSPLLPVVLSEQFVPGSFAFALDYLVDNALDLSAPVSLLPAWTAAPGGNSQGLQDLTGAGGAQRDHAAMHGAAMTVQNALIGWVFDVAGLHRQSARCAQRREGLVLGVPPPSFAMAHCHDNRILRQRSSAKRLNGTTEPELQTYNPL